MMQSGRANAPPRYRVGVRRIRYLVNWVVLVPLTALFAGLGVLVSLVDRSGNRTHGVARTWGRTLLWVTGIHLEVTGLEKLDEDGSYVFVANHHSALDIPALLAGLPYCTRMLAKTGLFGIPFLGWYIRSVGYIPVDRSDPRKARAALRSALEGADRGFSLVVFPEGTRSREGSIEEFKGGAVFLARESGLPLVPVAVVNSGRLMPSGKLRTDPGIIDLRIGEPVIAEETGLTRALADQIRQRVRRLAGADRIA